MKEFEQNQYGEIIEVGHAEDDEPLVDPRRSAAYRFFRNMVILLLVAGFLISFFNQ